MKPYLAILAAPLFLSTVLGIYQPCQAECGSQKNPKSVFVKPSKTGPLTAPENWPKFFDRTPLDRSPKGSTAKVVVLGTGDPTANPYRHGPALAVVVDKYPYFIDAGEGVWRAMAHGVLSNGEWLQDAFDIQNMKYLFLTHLHEDHTVGIPSWILNPYKFGCRQNKEVYGPKGTKSMIANILKAWKIDIKEMLEGSTHSSRNGSKAVCHDLTKDGKIFEDKRVKVNAYRTKHGALKYTFAYRFETKDRTFAFGGDGNYSEGLVKAAKDADILFIESCTFENLKYATWGGGSLEDKIKTVGAYHLFPKDLVRVKKESGVKKIVLIHEQNYQPAEKFSRLGLVEEIKRAGLKGPIHSSLDGDVY